MDEPTRLADAVAGAILVILLLIEAPETPFMRKWPRGILIFGAFTMVCAAWGVWQKEIEDVLPMKWLQAAFIFSGIVAGWIVLKYRHLKQTEILENIRDELTKVQNKLKRL